MEITSIVVVGGGAAGFHAAQELRSRGYEGSLAIVGAEPSPPYQRPPLSKGYLMGQEDRASVFLAPDAWYAEHGVDLRAGVSARAIDRAARTVELSDGSALPYDRLLLVTGSRPRVLGVPGADLPGVRALRTLADADALRSALPEAGSIVIVGAGWIGLEAAAAARIQGLEVTVLEGAAQPLLGVMGPQVGQVFADLHRQHGVDLRCGVAVQRFVGSAQGVEGVELADGSVVRADLVLVGVGAQPNVELAGAAGLAVDGGIVVDEFLRTGDPHIFAAGDVATAHHRLLGRAIRVEHYENAVGQGRAVAGSMLGPGEPYDDLPFFYSDQYDLGMEYVGYLAAGTEHAVVLRGDVAGLQFLAFWVSGQRVVAGMHVNVWDATDGIRDLVASGRSVDPARLADADVPLAEV